jgi:hypothetical protein
LSVSVERSACVLTLILAASLLPGCKKAADASRPDAGAAEPGDTTATADPLAELEQLEGRMRELGLAPAQPDDSTAAERTPFEAKVGEEERPEDLEEGVRPEPQTSPSPMPERDDHGGDHDGVSRCTSVCELSEAICELEVRICSMAKNHDGDGTYTNACERAVDDCELSGDACDTCVE